MIAILRRGILLLIAIGLVIAFAMALLVDRHEPHHRLLSEAISSVDPNWVPRVPDSTGKLVHAGDCGQATEIIGGSAIWHKIECPKQ